MSYEMKKRKVHHLFTGIKACKKINLITLCEDINTVLFPRHGLSNFYNFLTTPIAVQDHTTCSTIVLKIDQATDNTSLKTKSLYNPPVPPVY